MTAPAPSLTCLPAWIYLLVSQIMGMIPNKNSISSVWPPPIRLQSPHLSTRAATSAFKHPENVFMTLKPSLKCHNQPPISLRSIDFLLPHPPGSPTPSLLPHFLFPGRDEKRKSEITSEIGWFHQLLLQNNIFFSFPGVKVGASLFLFYPIQLDFLDYWRKEIGIGLQGREREAPGIWWDSSIPLFLTMWPRKLLSFLSSFLGLESIPLFPRCCKEKKKKQWSTFFNCIAN